MTISLGILELLLVFGGVLLLGILELRSLRRYQSRQREQTSTAQDAQRNE